MGREWGGGGTKGVGCGLGGIVATTSTKPAAFRGVLERLGSVDRETLAWPSRPGS
jgi:hypothetical protein